jgi:hypothetical protein
MGYAFITVAAALKIAVGRLLCTMIMDVPDECYRGINAYVCASAWGKGTPHPGSPDEPIQRAEFVDTAQLRARDIHPVDRPILSRWGRKPDGQPLYFRMAF